MKPDILLIGPLLDIVMESLEENYTVHRFWETHDQDALLGAVADKVTAVVTDGGLGAKRELLTQLPNVAIVAVYGVGVDSVDLDYCKEKRIAVTNTPNVLSDDVADMAVALMLSTCRQVPLGDRYCRSGNWPTQGALPLTTRMTGKRAGIFGMGSIGLRLASRLEAFSMDVSYCNRNRRSDANYRYYDDLKALANNVNFLIVCASASVSTQKIVNADILKALGPEGFLINVSRGSLVDEPALLAALQNGTIKGAGLDVFSDEPEIPAAFLSMDNVVLQPHHASGTCERAQLLIVG